MQTLAYVEIVIAAALIIIGVVSLVTRKPLGFSNEKFTQKSLENFSTVMGIIMILCGLCFAIVFEGLTGTVTGAPNNNLATFGNFGIIGAAIIYTILSKRYLVEKTDKKNKKKIASNKSSLGNNKKKRR